MENCIFCKIIKGEIKANIFYEDDNCVAFLDHEPVNLGHTLIVPKKHFEKISDLSREDFVGLSDAILKLSNGILSIADGMNFHQNNNRAAGQEVPHFHIHLIPRYEGDGHSFTWEKEKRTEEENQIFIDKIKRFLK